MRGGIQAAIMLAALCAGSLAEAASVEITARRAPYAIAGRYEWSLFLSTASGVVVDVVGVSVTEADSFSFNPANAAISVADSVFLADPRGDGTDFLVVVTILGQHLSSGSADRVLLGTFRSPSPYPFQPSDPFPPYTTWLFPTFNLGPGDDFFGFTAFALPTTVVQDWALIYEVPPLGEGPPLPYLAPEPSAFALASAALVVMVALRTARRRLA